MLHRGRVQEVVGPDRPGQVCVHRPTPVGVLVAVRDDDDRRDSGPVVLRDPDATAFSQVLQHGGVLVARLDVP
jgi:hypothetical protein